MMYPIRFHPLISRDPEVIARWIIEHADNAVANHELAEIGQVITKLARMPHMGSVRNEIAPDLLAIPAGRRAVIAFTVDDEAEEVLVQAVTYNGGDWTELSRSRLLHLRAALTRTG